MPASGSEYKEELLRQLEGLPAEKVKEILDFAENGSVELEELEQRKKGYVYIFDEAKTEEKVFSDQNPG